MNGNSGGTKGMELTETEYAISAGEYDAVVVAQGAALRRLQHRDRDLVVSFDAGAPIPDYRGVIAAPWPNRIADGKYTFDGVQHEVEINEPERNTALHGLVFDREWQVQEHGDSSVTLACELEPTTGYPFHLRLEVQYRLDGDGLHTTVTATNTGDRTAPYGVCPHPYLVAGSSPLDEWVLELPADTFLKVTGDRLLPVETATVQDHEFDFRSPRAIGGVEIDHAFTDINWNAEGRAALLLRDPAGTGVVGMSWDRTCPWLQVHTADKPEPLPNRLGLAVEPMTCPPDAFNSGTDLVRLKAGTTHSAGWSIFAS